MVNSNSDSWTKTITISFSKTLVVGFAISIMLCLLFWSVTYYFTSSHPNSIEIITLFSGCLVGISLTIASKTIASGKSIHLERIEFDSALFLHKLVSNWYNDLSFHVGSSRNIMKKNMDKFNTKEGCRELLEHFYNNPKEMESFYAVLNFLEHISIMVQNKILNESAVKEYFGGIFRTYYTTTKIFIDTAREHDGDHKKASFCSFEKLAEKWIY